VKQSSELNSQTILLTGGTGSFGTAFIRHLLSENKFKGVIRIFSRNESKQLSIRQEFKDSPSLRFLIGDIRDMERVLMAMRGADLVVHAAALRQISALEYNPFEAINTNIIGTQHVIRAAIETGVKRAIFVSSSEACHPENLSGLTKSTAEKLFIQSNFYAIRIPKFSVTRCGDDLGNFDNLIPNLLRQKSSGTIKIGDKNMSRFWSTAGQTAKFVWDIAPKIQGGEIFVPKLHSVKVTDLAAAISPKAKLKMIGIKPGETTNEILITPEEMKKTLEFKHYFLIRPPSGLSSYLKIKGVPTKRIGAYNNADNNRWLTGKKLQSALK
jgi:UDP-N-acetylglucosamine 4,6-dehydratase